MVITDFEEESKDVHFCCPECGRCWKVTCPVNAEGTVVAADDLCPSCEAQGKPIDLAA